MKVLYKITTLAMLCFACLQALAQQPCYRLIGKAAGLPSNTVYDVKQGKNGCIWVGTDKGLCKYDGVNVYLYNNPQQTGKGVTDIYVLDNGEVYCQNFSGQLLYTQNGTLQIETAVGTSNNYYPMRRIGPLLLFFSNEDIHILNPYLHKAKTVHIPGAAFDFTCVNNNRLYFYNTSSNLVVYDGKTTQTVTTISQGPETIIKQFYSLPNGLLMARANNSLSTVFDYNGGFKEFPGIDNSALLQNVVTIDNDVWLCTSIGLYRYTKKLKQLGNKPYFSNYRISSIIKDREGAYWISTLDNGLSLCAQY
ncbi:MAG: hypothetical protein M0D57_04400 [Sphingobacteriales bacterium JAD_PAG50586_3]|nr:MAG: hypothetical protein M0D57_04400 [Sphingobacteriales bacterium JAD_PAG50586_3]